MIVVLIIAVGIMTAMSARLQPYGATIAEWTPAVAVALLAVVVSRRAPLLTAGGVTVAMTIGSVVGGRELVAALGLGLAGGLEAWVASQVLRRDDAPPRLHGTRDVLRLMAAAAAGALVAGVVTGVLAAFMGEDFLATLIDVLSSHGSSLLVIVPLVIAHTDVRDFTRKAEATVQLALLVSLLAATFVLGEGLPLAFLPIVALQWAAFRLPMIIVALQIVGTGAVAIIATGQGYGPFSAFIDVDPATALLLLQLFVTTLAVSTLLVAASRNEWADAVVRVDERESLLRTGMLNSETGILIAEITGDDRLKVVTVNGTALRALGRSSIPDSWSTSGIPSSEGRQFFGVREVDELVAQRTSGTVEVVRQGSTFGVDVAMHENDGGATIVTLGITDVTARDERERRAVSAAEQFRELNRQKDDFIASISHELRTPVTSIIGFSEVLEEVALPEQARDATAIISRNAQRLAEVIEDVLALSALSAGGSSPRPVGSLDLAELLLHAIDEASGLAPRRAVEIRMESGREPIPITSVRAELTRVFANLLSNAVKFSPDGGTVVVTVEPLPGGPVVTITDEGPGIPPEHLDAVWDRFYRVPDGPHRTVPGTGLGLPIVRGLVERRLGGSVVLDSDGVRGTTARVTLPWNHHHADAAV